MLDPAQPNYSLLNFGQDETIMYVQYSGGNLLLPIILDIWYKSSLDGWLWNWAFRLSLFHRLIDIFCFVSKNLLNTNLKEWSLLQQDKNAVGQVRPGELERDVLCVWYFQHTVKKLP